MKRIIAALVAGVLLVAFGSVSQADTPAPPPPSAVCTVSTPSGDWSFLCWASTETTTTTEVTSSTSSTVDTSTTTTTIASTTTTTTVASTTTTSTTLPATTTTEASTTTVAPTTTSSSTTTTGPSGLCPQPANTPGGSDGQGGCFPGAFNTGVPDGLTLHSCALTISTAGTYDLCQFNGDVRVNVTGVTITRSLINGEVYSTNEDLRGLVISDSTIDCHCLSQGASDTPIAIGYNNYTLRRVEILDTGHGVTMGSNVTVQDSWIHGLGGNTDAHKDGFYVGDGTNSVIRHNTVECNDGSHAGCTSAIGLLTDFGPVTHYVIDGNLLNTIGSYCFYGSGGPSKGYHSSYITFTNNVFGQAIYPRCGYYGPVTYFDTSQPGMVWSGNRFANGVTVPPVN